MKKTAIGILAMLLVIALIVIPTAAAINSPFKSPQVTFSKASVSGMVRFDPAKFEPYIAMLNGMELPPPPEPKLSLPGHLGGSVTYANLFIPGTCPGGCCGCCC